MTIIVQLVVVMFIIFLAIWCRGGVGQFLYIVASPVAIVFGLSLYSTYSTPLGFTLAIVMAAIGLYMLVVAILNLLR